MSGQRPGVRHAISPHLAAGPRCVEDGGAKHRRSPMAPLGVQGVRSSVLLFLLSVMLSACALELPGSGPAPTASPASQVRPRAAARNTAVVKRGDVVEVAKLIGRVTPAREQELSFLTNGRVKAVLAEAGKMVGENDLLVQLDTGDLESRIESAQVQYELALLKVKEHKAQQEQALAKRALELETAALAVRQAQAALVKAEADLAQLQAGPSAVEKAEAQVRAARRELEDAKYNLIVVQKSDVVSKNVREREYEHNWYEVRYGQTREKYLRGEAPKSQLDGDWSNLLLAKERLDTARAQAAAALATAEGRVAQAEEKLKQAEADLKAKQAIPVDPEVQAAELAVEQARLALSKAQADYETKAMEPAEDLELALLERSADQARASLDQLLAQREAAELRAPFAGRITSVRVKVGDQVSAYQGIVVLSDPGELLVRADASDADLARLAVGQKVSVTLDTLPGTTLNGEVVSLPGGSTVASGAPDRSVRIRVEWPRPPQVGSLARLTVEIRRKEGVLAVPASAVKTVGRRTFVEYLDGDLRRSANVEVGVAGESEVEIARGLQEGQVVLVGP